MGVREREKRQGGGGEEIRGADSRGRERQRDKESERQREKRQGREGGRGAEGKRERVGGRMAEGERAGWETDGEKDTEGER